MRPPNATTPAGRVPDAFLALLPEGAGRDIVCLRAAGHYVKVTTTTGTQLFCCASGRHRRARGLRMQVHRGYWIAHDHVVAIVRRGTLMALRLTTGDVVPVSRPFLAATRQRYRCRTVTTRDRTLMHHEAPTVHPVVKNWLGSRRYSRR